MRRLVAVALASLCSIVSLVFMPLTASATATWQTTITKLPTYTTTHAFSVQYAVLSTRTDSFTVQLQQSNNGGEFFNCGSPRVTSDDPNPNAANGNSGSVPACIDNDGAYSFRFLVTPAEEGAQPTSSTSTIVDTIGPAAPIYGGKTQNGTNYVLRFTAPDTADVSTIQIFASTAKTYQAGDSTRIGLVSTSPNQQFSFAYTAPDGAARYFAIEAFDAAGNGSPVVGDPGTVVHPLASSANGGQSSNGSAAAAIAEGTTTTGGQVQGATSNGTVNAPGSGKTQKNSTGSGKVLGITTTNSSSSVWWYIVGAIIIVLLGWYYWLLRRRKLHARP